MTTNRQTTVIEGDKHMCTNLKTPRVLIAAIAVAALALVWTAAPPVQAAGLRNCVEITGPGTGKADCYELVWANGVQVRMTFAIGQFAGAIPSDKVANFYVMAPQTDTPQGALPFPHDHVVGGDSTSGTASSSSAALRASPAAAACRR